MVYEHPLFGKVRMFVENGKTWFCGTDIATSLGYSNPRDAIVRHCKSHGVVNHDVIDSMGRIQQMKFISEGNIYRLTAKSQMPKADEFESWIFDDIVPSVINTGGYSVQPQLPNFNNPAEAARAWADQYEKNQTLALEVQQQQETIELQQQELTQSAPKVSYYDNHLQSVNTQTSTQVAKQIGMDAEKLHKKLKEIGIIYRQSGQWILHAPYSTWGMHSTRTQTYTRSDGSIGTSVYTVWTQRGVRFIIALYENGWNVKKAIKQIKGELNPAA
jgi:prophage antirepressor-like protein